MPRMRFSVLDVGQGSGQFIEVFDDANPNKPVTAMLIDLGSSQKYSELGEPAAAFVAQQLNKMTHPTLEAVFLSHPDKDHVNLVDFLLGKFTPFQLTIKKVWYGGDRDGYIKQRPDVDYLAELQKYMPFPATLDYPGLTESSMRDPDSTKWVSLASGSGVQVFLLVGNAVRTGGTIVHTIRPKKPRPDGYKINTSSLVLLVAYAGEGILVMGDATGLTIWAGREILAGHGQYELLSLTLPHHGSTTTTFDIKGVQKRVKGGEPPALTNIKQFLAALKPVTISASAWEFKTFKHPHVDVIDAFSTYLNAGLPGLTIWSDPALAAGEHFLRPYMPTNRLKQLGGGTTRWPPSADWWTLRTAKPVFTTDYFDFEAYLRYPSYRPPTTDVDYQPATFVAGKQPARAVAWGFEVIQSGGLTTAQIAPVLDRTFLDSLPREHAEWLVGDRVPEEDRYVFLAPERDAASAPPPPPLRRVAPAAPAVPGAAPPPRLRRLA